MTNTVDKNAPETFLPDITVRDPLGRYWLRQVTLQLRRELCWAWHERGLRPGDHPGLLPPFADRTSVSLDMARFRDDKAEFFKSDPTAQYLSEQIDGEPPPADDPDRGTISWVAQELQLDPVSLFVLALGLLPTVDSATASVLASCSNDPSKLLPTLALVQSLWTRPDEVIPLSDPLHSLNRFGLIQFRDRSGQFSSTISWESQYTVSSLVAGLLLYPSRQLPNFLSRLPSESGHFAENEFSPETVAAASVIGHHGFMVVPIQGTKGSPYDEIAVGLSQADGRDVVAFRGPLSALEDRSFLVNLGTSCWLQGVDIFFGPSESSLLCGDKHSINTYLMSLSTLPIRAYVSITDRQQVEHIAQDTVSPAVGIPGLTYHERVSHWKRVLGPYSDGLKESIEECARRIRFEKKTIDKIGGRLARSSEPVGNEGFIRACRAEVELDLAGLAQKVPPRFANEELILPHKQQVQFNEIIRAMKSLTRVHYKWGTAEVWNESGISVLFAGPSGTGKTMAAEVLALKLDLPIYRIDLSQVVSKYIGETEKNLKKLFDAADIADVILFFDEADALFGKRTEVRDSHDRYANLEISYLLERMERFKGLAILATNRRKDLDQAFLRRLRYIVEFPLPNVPERKRIWNQAIPNKVDRSDIDVDFLARQFPLSGGNIRSVVFNACLQAADGSVSVADQHAGRLEMAHVVSAVKREYDKMDRTVSLEQFGRYASVVKEMEYADGKKNRD